MLRRFFLMGIIPLSVFTKGYSWEPLRPDTTKEMQTYIFGSIDVIENNRVFLSGDIKKYGLTYHNIADCINKTFQEKGLSPNSSLDNPEVVYRNRALLQMKVIAVGNTVSVEAELSVDAFLLKSHTYIPGMIWKERAILNRENSPDMQKNILFYVHKFVSEVLDIYLESRDGLVVEAQDEG